MKHKSRFSILEIICYFRKQELIRFLQVKHVLDEGKAITYEDLFSNDKIKIEKYFKSFADPKYFKVDKTEDLILFANLALDADVLPFLDALPADDPI